VLRFVSDGGDDFGSHKEWKPEHTAVKLPDITKIDQAGKGQMTGYTVHTGASKKFVSGWDRVFGQGTGTSDKKATSDKKEKSASAGKSAANKKTERSQNASGSTISAGKKKAAPAKKKRGGR
jgi:hypothetical protein